MKYLVTIPEIWHRQHVVEADSAQEALDKVYDDAEDCESNTFQYADTYDKSECGVGPWRES